MNGKSAFLKALRRAADEVCEAAFNSNARPNGAINWGDLGCVSAEYYITEDDTEGYRVHIEEADPDNYELQKFIFDTLTARGYPNVEVVTNW